MRFVTSEVIAIDTASKQLMKLELVLSLAEEVKNPPEQFRLLIDNARAFLNEKKSWLDQALRGVFNLGPLIIVSAGRIEVESVIAANLIEKYLKELS